MPNKTKIFFASLCCLIPLTACLQQDKIVNKLAGIYDGLSYTSPYGFFSTHLKDWADLKSVKDGQENNGATMVLNFQDKSMNEYQIAASLANPELNAHDLVTRMVAKGQAEGKNVVAATTADGEECLMAQSLLKEKDSDKGYALMTVIFLRKGTIFDLGIKTHPEKEPEKAAELAKQCFRDLWNRSALRGQVQDFEKYPEDIDPRVPVVTLAAGRVAVEMGLEAVIERGKKAIVRIIGKGSEGPMTLSLGIAAKENEIITTEAVSSKANDMKTVSQMQSEFYRKFGEAVAAEQLTINRSNAFDPDLAQLPVKGK
ncbi:MAG: hypothetical protein AB1439_10835 [candidate division FCPU426 bacterium]